MTEFATIITAMGVLLGAFAAAAAKIWHVVSNVNTQLQEIADEADDRRKEAEHELSALRVELVALKNEVHSLRQEAQRWESEQKVMDALRIQNAALLMEISVLKARLKHEA